LTGHTHEVTAFGFFTDKNNQIQYIVSGSSDKTIRIWDMKTFKQVWVCFLGDSILSLDTIDNDGIAAGDSNGKLYMLRVFGLTGQDGDLPIHKFDFRVGKVVNCKPHPSADSLYVEEIDVGEGSPRQIISGLARYIHLQHMKNRKVVVLCNIPPATLRGLVSNGMVVGVTNNDHSMVELLDPPSKATAGERLSIENLPNNNKTAKLEPLDFGRDFPSIENDLYTNAQLYATYKGQRFMTSAGPVTVKSLANGRIA